MMKLPGRPVHNPQHAFLPGALSVQETPPSPAGRALLWLILALFSVALCWACIGEVDVVVSAPGRVVPSGYVKSVQAPEAGTVARLYVREGEVVAAGQALLELDPVIAEAELARLHGKLAELSQQLAWRHALEQWFATGTDELYPMPLMPGVLAIAERSRVRSLYEQQRSQMAASFASADGEYQASLAAQESLEAELQRTTAMLSVLRERVDAYAALLQNQQTARVQYLELRQQQTELELSLPVLHAKRQQMREQATAMAEGIEAERRKLRLANLMEISSIDAEHASIFQEVVKIEQRRKQQQLVAPVNGTVQELVVHHAGAVVTPAQTLLKIVPEHAAMEVEATLQNKDIGFVRNGQEVEVKVDTFNFTKYGLLAAKVKNISNDAVEDKKKGWVYRMQIQLQSDQLTVGEKLVRLSPGMAVTAEIKTGRRRLIEFVLAPLMRYKHESVRER